MRNKIFDDEFVNNYFHTFLDNDKEANLDELLDEILDKIFCQQKGKETEKNNKKANQEQVERKAQQIEKLKARQPQKYVKDQEYSIVLKDHTFNYGTDSIIVRLGSWTITIPPQSNKYDAILLALDKIELEKVANID